MKNEKNIPEEYDKDMEREKLKTKIKRFIELNGEPDGAYYYDDCVLVFEYNGKLASTKFDFWEENVLIGKNALVDMWSELLKEIGLCITIISILYYEDEDEDGY